MEARSERYEVLTQALGPQPDKDGRYDPDAPRVVKQTTRIVMAYERKTGLEGHVSIESYQGDVPRPAVLSILEVDPLELEEIFRPGIRSIRAKYRGEETRVILTRRFPHVRGFEPKIEGVNSFRTEYIHEFDGERVDERYELTSTNKGITLTGIVQGREYRSELPKEATPAFADWMRKLGEEPRRFARDGVEITAIKRGPIYIAARFNTSQPRLRFD